ncbi:signal transduction histidine kinase [Parvibaculum lavamentivorans DS-1]|uniref:Blue-light-activated histidine kinase n=1 Tax=Parvibaculum lavamentivorans (strain DS-1 / DSM 13023 / NCIMB 13966) TaxID=402881 RepID=A7HPZ8_PARL1|nr:PAS domain S-box protein [Parvibaculum lavamentivorans]ABS61981.1 signal transduction histidine kinase [Parvibaculum lavamentivorans DS-1]
MISDGNLLQALPVAVYTTDAEGRITFYNEAAAALWGHRPELGTSMWCGSWRLFWPDGRPLPHDECPMAITLREQREVRGVEAVLERPDGTRVLFLPYPTLLRDEAGRVTGAINLLVEVADRKEAEAERAQLAAIVSSSDDAIISKTLTGKITSWNAGATRIFGYEPQEIIGQSILRIIPPDLQDEEKDILAKIQRGERIEHYDTVRVAKDGTLLNISLTVSPLIDGSGKVVGASKVARNITERKRAEEMQRLLFDELNHRVKNTLATIQAIASQSLQKAASPSDFVTSFNGRVEALGRAHELLVQGQMSGADVAGIVREQVVLGDTEGARVSCSGPYVRLEPRVAVQVALVLHELATNARKYGALSIADGHLSIEWRLDIQDERKLVLEWKESGVRNVRVPTSHGFGTILIQRTVEAHGGEASIHYGADGISCQIGLPLPQSEEAGRAGSVVAAFMEEGHRRTAAEASSRDLRGTRVLLIEDEPLIAMDTESHLVSAGCEVVGLAATIEEARQLIADKVFDIALVDANLSGEPVDEIAVALARKGIPFAFATGYGAEALPPAFRDAPILTKPFSPQALLAEVAALRARNARPGIIPLRPKAG